MSAIQIKLGILDCDTLHEDLRKEYVSYSSMFQALLVQVAPTVSFTSYRVIDGVYPESFDECDGYIITGSKSSVYDNDEWIIKLGSFVRNLASHRKTMVGICFGHQLLAHVLGGRTSKSDKGWGVGAMQSEVVDTPKWMQTEMSSYSLLVSHQDQVIQLPPNARLIATSPFCTNSAFQIEGYALGFQGHPEFSRGYSRRLMEMRRDRIPHERIEKGLDSLETNTDHMIIAEWIVNFMIY